jgi:hypothetical protein
MPSLKSDINVTVRVGGNSFSIGGVKLPNGKYAIKRGRSWARKIPVATLSEIFAESRKWAARQA